MYPKVSFIIQSIKRSKALRLIWSISFLGSLLGVYAIIRNFIHFGPVNVFGVSVSKDIMALTLYLLGIFALFVAEILHWGKKKKTNPLFPKVDFSASDKAIRSAKLALIDGEGASPEFVHIAAKLAETEKVIRHLSGASNFAFIGGESGTGKSTVALQAAYHFFQKEKRNVYTVKADLLYHYIDKERKEMEEVLDLIADKPATLVFDDAHRLDLLYKNKFKGILQEYCSRNKLLNIIWIETNFELETELDEAFLQIDIGNSAADVIAVLETFKEDPEMAVKLPGLDDAKAAVTGKNKVKDVWQLSLISSKAEQQLRTLFASFSDFDQLAMLYLVSLNTVLTGEKDRDQTFFFQKYSELAKKPEFSWFNPHEAREKLKKLNQPQGNMRRLIQLTPAGAGMVTVSSLHYKFARMIIRLLHESPQFNEKYLSILDMLLRDPQVSDDIQYLHVWLKDNPAARDRFFENNTEWVIDHLNNLDPNRLSGYVQIIKMTTGTNAERDLFDQINKEGVLTRLEDTPLEQLSVLTQFLALFPDSSRMLKRLKKDKIVEQMNAVNAETFQKTTQLLNYAHGLKVFDFHNALNLERIAKEISSSPSLRQLSSIYHYQEALKKKGPEFLALLDVESIAEKINASESVNIQHVNDLLRVLPYEKFRNLVELLNFNHLAEQANQMSAVELQELGEFLKTLHFRKEGFILSLNLEMVAHTANQAKGNNFDSIARFINALSPLSGRFVELLNLPHFAALVHQADFNRYQGINRFVSSLGERKGEFLELLDVDILAAKANTAKINHFWKLSYLISVLGNRRPDFLKRLNLAAFAEEFKDMKIADLSALNSLLRSTHDRAPEMRALLNHSELIRLVNSAELSGGNLIRETMTLFSDDRHLLLDGVDMQKLAEKIHLGGFKQLQNSENFYMAMYDRKETITNSLDLAAFAEEVNGLNNISKLTGGVFRLPSLLRITDNRIHELFPSIKDKVITILDYAYAPQAIELSELIDQYYPGWTNRINWVKKMMKYGIDADQISNITIILEKIQHMTVQKEYAHNEILKHKTAFQAALVELISNFRKADRLFVLSSFCQAIVKIHPQLAVILFDESVQNQLKKMKFTAEEYGALQELFSVEEFEAIFEKVILSEPFQESYKKTLTTEYFPHFAEDHEKLRLTMDAVCAVRQ